MRIVHCSDLHGHFPELPWEFDAVVCSGDFFKHNQFKVNYTPQRRQSEIQFQTNWLKSKIPFMKEWLKGKPLIWCSGNHDFLNPCDILNDHGIETIDLDNRLVEYKGFMWYGFPYVPTIRGEWNWEKDPTDLKQEVNNMISRIKEAGYLDKLDILVAHCPPNGILDLDDGCNIGNRFMNSAINYALRQPLKLYLTGHVHQSRGYIEHGETLISNAANMARLISFIDNKWNIDATIKDSVIS